MKIRYVCKKTGVVFAYKTTTKSEADKEKKKFSGSEVILKTDSSDQ